MIICKKCGEKFSNWIKIDGKFHNLQNRKFCLECSPFKQHNTIDLSRPEIPPEMRFCTECEKVKPITEFSSNGKYLCANCKKCASPKTIERQRKRKKECLKYKGERCIICGYNKHDGSLVFHHIDPTQKDFGISRWTTASLERTKSELDKCVLVCANCHGEIHGGLVDLKNYL